MLGNVRYITATIAKENTTVDTIKTIEDTAVNILIVQAQLMIDWYLEYINGISVNEDTLYPVYDADWVTETDVPLGIQQATVMVVDWIYNSNAFGSVWTNWEISEEKTWPHTVKYSEQYLADLQKKWLPAYIVNILDKYKLSLFSNVI